MVWKKLYMICKNVKTNSILHCIYSNVLSAIALCKYKKLVRYESAIFIKCDW